MNNLYVNHILYQSLNLLALALNQLSNRFKSNEIIVRDEKLYLIHCFFLERKVLNTK